MSDAKSGEIKKALEAAGIKVISIVEVYKEGEEKKKQKKIG